MAGGRNDATFAAAAILAGGILYAPSADAELFSRGSGYPTRGKAIDQLQPARDYSDLAPGRPRSLGILRARAQGFVPSPELHDYVRGVLMRMLAGVKLPPSFNPDVRILAAPEFSALCTPDGTIVVTVGLLEQLENEDELAFVLAHEVSHAIYRHHASDWYKKAQYYSVVNSAAVDGVARGIIAGSSNLARGIDLFEHLEELSANLLGPQMERGQEDGADALGFDLMVKAGYDSEAALSVMDKLAEQEAEAARAAERAKASQAAIDKKPGSSSSGLLAGLGTLGSIVTQRRTSSDLIADLATFAFDTAVDNIAADATTHHPAALREDLLSAYEFNEYRSIIPNAPTPLAWSGESKSPMQPQLNTILAHYGAAEDAASFIADPAQGKAADAKAAVALAVEVPTADHAYTEFVASELYEKSGDNPLAEAALVRAANGPEPSWSIYSRLLDIYIARSEYGTAQILADQAATRFDNSPILLPKRIELYRLEGRQADADKLLPQCDAFDIHELYDECKRAASKS